jgi:putative hydrolase of the HAD superfamily
VGKVIFDFDGTLAHRPGMWSQCMVDVLDDLSPGHGLVADDVRPHLRDGFPWHRPDQAHLHLSTPDLWWDDLTPLLRRTYQSVGVDSAVLDEAVATVRQHYCDPARYQLFPDTIEALVQLGGAGWELVVLSNHVPELPVILEGVGLAGLINEVFSSATIGFEKPHPEAYRIAAGRTSPTECFMIGDNPEADVFGAERAGLRAILVRNLHPEVNKRADKLLGAAQIVMSSS